MEPSEKNDLFDQALVQIFGVSRKDAIVNNVCVGKPIGCGEPITPFRDAVSEKEYRISGLCQACQDDTFTPGPV